ncbi:MAG: hypothetical protein JO257_20065, partial [Deltaproteobacteria bacterium]|nr:hypothetical protein [Deltaproteobacteria bacterium]
QWLEPSTAQNWYNPGSTAAIHTELADGKLLGLMGAALMIGIVGIALAWALYGRGPSPTVTRLVDHGPLEGAYIASKNKLWFDEIYDATIVRPFRAVARGLFEVVDRFIIDTVAVNGSAFVVGLFGRVSRWVQNGNIQRYLAGLVIGAAAVFLVTDCHQKPSFIYRFEGQNGEMLHLHAEPGAGIVGSSAKLRWDTDGDGQPDHEGRDVTVRAGEAAAKITLFIDDPISQKTVPVTRAIRAEEVQP